MTEDPNTRAPRTTDGANPPTAPEAVRIACWGNPNAITELVHRLATTLPSTLDFRRRPITATPHPRVAHFLVIEGKVAVDEVDQVIDWVNEVATELGTACDARRGEAASLRPCTDADGTFEASRANVMLWIQRGMRRLSFANLLPKREKGQLELDAFGKPILPAYLSALHSWLVGNRSFHADVLAHVAVEFSKACAAGAGVLDEKGSADRWLHRVTEWKTRDLVQAQVVHATTVNAMAPAPSPASGSSELERAVLLRQVLAKAREVLDPRDLAVIELDLEGRQSAEIAKLVGTTEGNVRSIRLRAQERLSGALVSESENDTAGTDGSAHAPRRRQRPDGTEG